MRWLASVASEPPLNEALCIVLKSVYSRREAEAKPISCIVKAQDCTLTPNKYHHTSQNSYLVVQIPKTLRVFAHLIMGGELFVAFNFFFMRWLASAASETAPQRKISYGPKHGSFRGGKLRRSPFHA